MHILKEYLPCKMKNMFIEDLVVNEINIFGKFLMDWCLIFRCFV